MRLPPRTGEGDLLPPVPTRVHRVLQVRRQALRENRQMGVKGGDFGQGSAALLFERDAQYLLGGLVGRMEPALLVEREHAVGQPLEHRFEIPALLLELALTPPGGVAGLLELPCHFVEGGDEKSDFFLARRRQAGLVVAGGNRPSAQSYIAQRRDQATGRVQRHPTPRRRGSAAAPATA